jgi:hypothetical protein
MDKGQWIFLPYKSVRDLKSLRVSASFPNATVALALLWTTPSPTSMPKGSALPHLKLCSSVERSLVSSRTLISDADRRFGPVHLIKVDIADGIYRLYLNSTYTYPSLASSSRPSLALNR